MFVSDNDEVLLFLSYADVTREKEAGAVGFVVAASLYRGLGFLAVLVVVDDLAFAAANGGGFFLGRFKFNVEDAAGFLSINAKELGRGRDDVILPICCFAVL